MVLLVVTRGSKYLRIRSLSGKVDAVLINQLKPHYRVLEEANEQPLGGPYDECLNDPETLPLPGEEASALPPELLVTPPTSPVSAVLSKKKKKKTLKTYAKAVSNNTSSQDSWMLRGPPHCVEIGFYADIS